MPTGIYPRPLKTFDRKVYRKKYYQEHKDTEKNNALNNYYLNLEEKKEGHRKWSKENRVKINEYRKTQYKNPLFKLSMRLRGRFNKAVTRDNNRAIDLIGCTMCELKIYLEKQFKEGMSWDNWNYRGWHIDHIKPISSFNLKDEQEIQEAFHYTNLQPMWGVDNMTKGKKL